MGVFIPKPPFPNVPKLPGVPQLPRSPFFPPGPPPGLSGIIAVGRLALALTSKPQWGIYKIEPPTSEPTATVDPDTGEDVLDTVVITPPAPPVIVPDNFARLDYQQEWDVGTMPAQKGAFANYNKVASPYQLKLRMTKGGTLKDRQEFLATLETISASLDLYKILTPERVYQPTNIFGFRVVREGARGAYYFAEVEISFMEIRQVAALYTTTAQNTQNAKQPSALPVNNMGTLNATPPTTRVQAAINTVLAPLRSLAAIIGS